MPVSKIFLICSALLIVGCLADNKDQWEAPESKLSNEAKENFASKTKEKVEVEGSGGWEELNDPIVKAMESEFKGKPEEEFSAQGKSKFFWYTVIITHIIHRVLA